MPSTSSGPSNNIGYSFAATPSPISTPASTGRRRAHASSPPAANAVASASKLVNIWKITSGDAPTSAASQTRRPARPAVAHNVANHANANPSAATSKNTTTSAMTGSRISLLKVVYVLANAIDTYWYTPVRTGYSM